MRTELALDRLGRQALHAYLLALEHPGTGEVLEWTSEPPADIAALQKYLRASE